MGKTRFLRPGRNELSKLAKIVALEIKSSIGEKWFYLYFVLFCGLMAGFLWSGITESQVLGFSGLSRVLITYIEITIIILPLFILVTTVRSVVMEKESLVLEYMISLPVSTLNYYWGKFIGRFVIIVIPVLTAISGSAIWASIKGLNVIWAMVFSYSLLVLSLSLCFLGFSYFVSSLSRKQDTAVLAAFFVWFVFVMFLDVALLGIFLKFHAGINVVLAATLANPIELFRIAAYSLFDPKLSIIGPVAWTVMAKLGHNGLMLFSFLYPAFLGILTSYLGYVVFKENDFL
jgi:ABC-2 type transport system permease protein